LGSIIIADGQTEIEAASGELENQSHFCNSGIAAEGNCIGGALKDAGTVVLARPAFHCVDVFEDPCILQKNNHKMPLSARGQRLIKVSESSRTRKAAPWQQPRKQGQIRNSL